MAAEQEKQIVREFVATMLAEARRLAAEGMPAEQAVDLVLQQAKLAVAVGKLNA